ncbi:hypothetical protein [Sphingobacterium kyonggiense]
MKTINALLIITILVSMIGCSETKKELNLSEAYLKVELISSEISNDENSNNQNQKASVDITEKVEAKVKFSQTSEVAYEFEREKLKSPNNRILKGSQKAAIERNPLGEGIKYVLLAYDESGNFVAENYYSYGSENSTQPMKLDAGKTYTFIAYSENSKTSLPTIVNKEKISTSKALNVSGDLMVFKTKLKLNYGENFLGIILKHRFSSITTNFTIDPNTSGYFKTINNTYIFPTHSSANFNFNDETIVYNSLNQNGTLLNFPTLQLDQRTVSSYPSILISPTTSTVSLRFGSITIDDETKTNFIVPNIKITPGTKYILKLNFRTCTETVGNVQGMNWSYAEAFDWLGRSGIWKDGKFYLRGETISQTITAPASDYGFVFDITKLDNAFNMELNGVKLAKNEIQFEKGASSSQNIRFKDLSLYQGINSEGGNNIGAIYNMTGTSSAPLVKVVISKNGEVRIFGSKVSGGPLYELELFNNNSFNNFPWDKTKNNVIKVTQLVDGRTILIGSGSGKKKISCK